MANDTTASIANESFTRKYGNVITIALWVAALSSHAFLLPKLLRDLKK
ncbi:MAG: hypothetical protein NVS2B12_21400 [Ktedonobacteraceae bacterium]